MLSQHAVTFPRFQSTSVFPLFPNLGGMLSHSLGMPSAKISRETFGHACFSETFSKFNGVFFSTLSARVESPHVMSEIQKPGWDSRCQSGPSARNSFVFSEGDSLKNYGADQQRLQVSDHHFVKFTTAATFA